MNRLKKTDQYLHGESEQGKATSYLSVFGEKDINLQTRSEFRKKGVYPFISSKAWHTR